MKVSFGLLLLLLVLGSTRCANAQTPPSPETKPVLSASSILKSADLSADLAILRRAYETLHPGLYRYNTPDEMAQSFRELEEKFAVDRTLAETFCELSIFAAKIKCGHTYVSFYNQSDAVEAALFKGPRVPFFFRWAPPNMIVTKSFVDDPRLRPGSIVEAINGVDVDYAYHRLTKIARADGTNPWKRKRYIEVHGADAMEAFDIFYPLYFPPKSEMWKVRVRPETGAAPVEIEVRPQTFDERKKIIESLAPPKNADGRPNWEWKKIADGVALLTMDSWVLYRTKWDAKGFLKGMFEALQKDGYGNLVIDLRAVEGGNDVGDEIASYLSEKPLRRVAVERRVRYRKVPDDLKPYLDTWDKSFFDWGEAAKEEKNGFFRLRRDADDDVAAPIQPQSPNFRGRVWVMIGPENSSAAFEFALTLRQNRIGTLVGEPTGGSRRGINGGCFFFLRLPRTGIELDLPLIGQFPLTDEPDQGVIPDEEVFLRPSDIAAGRDPVLNFILTEIRKTAGK